MLNPSLLQLLFEEDLQGQNEHTLTFPGQIHITKFAFSKSSANFKVFQIPATPGINGNDALHGLYFLSKLDTMLNKMVWYSIYTYFELEDVPLDSSRGGRKPLVNI